MVRQPQLQQSGRMLLQLLTFVHIVALGPQFARGDKGLPFG